MRLKTILLSLFLVISLGVLAGCDSAKTRAEKHYQAALALLEKGDEERAIIEFRNVFKLDGKHHEARAAYAALQEKRGNLQEAAGQYLRLIEQYPDDVDARVHLTALYARFGNWPEMEQHLKKLAEQAPDNSQGQALQLVYDYQDAARKGDERLQEDIAQRARALGKSLPENMDLRRIVIDRLVGKADFRAALQELDAALRIAPDDRSLYAVRLSVLQALGDPLAIEAQLKDMVSRFPGDETVRDTLVRWYVSQGQPDSAEAYLRRAAERADAAPGDYLKLLSFLEQIRGRDAAQSELDRIIATGKAPLALEGLKAGYVYAEGKQQEAIARLRAVLQDAPAGDASRKLRVVLANMLAGTGKKDEARKLVGQVLKEDAANPDAAKLEAGWLIDDDQVGDAIVLLRKAIEGSPRDAGLLDLLALAHARNGDKELQGDTLSLAYDVSGKKPEQALRYARYLLAQGRAEQAEQALVGALRLAPQDVSLLAELGSLYVQRKDWPRAEQVKSTLARMQLDAATQAANDLQNRIFQGQDKKEEAIAFLQRLVDSGQAGFAANFEIVRNYLDEGKPEKARETVEALLRDNPKDLGVRFLDATLDVATGHPDSAQDKYRAILAEDDRQPQIWLALYRVLAGQGKTQAARKVVEDALAALPGEPTLLWVRAGLLENDGDVAGAIEIYEGLYRTDSSNPVIANNLASLLVQEHQDAATLARATAIVRRLRNSQVPAFQDTFGWIAYLRGENEEALRTLEPAAKGMPDDARVQYHLAMAYLAAGFPKKAAGQFRAVVKLTSLADTRPFVEDSRKQLAALAASAGGGQ